MKKYILASLLAFLMIGCDGGSKPIIDSNSKIRGIAVDDLIVNGIVNVYSATDESKPLVTGRTSPEYGSYNLDLDYLGLVIVKVTCDNDSKMLNPQTKIKKNCISNLELSSATTLKKNSKKVTVNISPLSELVVRQMRENGLSSASLASAQENIGLMFNFDPIGDNPVANDRYSKVIGSIHSIADAQSDKSIMDIIDEINEDLKDGKADDQISVDLAVAMKKAGVNNNLTKSDGVFDANNKDEKKKEDTTEDQKATDIKIAKAFFEELRTQAMSVVDYDNSGTAGFLDNEAENLSKELELVSLNFDLASRYLVGILGDILELVDNNQTEYQHATEDQMDLYLLQDINQSDMWTYSIKDDGVEKYKGSVTFPSDIPDDISPINFTSLISKFDGTLPSSDLNNNTQGVQTFKSDINLTKESYGASLVLINASLSDDNGSIALSDAKIRAGYSYDDTKAEDEKLDMKFVALDSITVKGSTLSYDLEGLLSVVEYVTNESIKNKGFEENGDDFYNSGVLPKKIEFVGTLLNRKTKAKIQSKIKINWLNAKSMDLLGESNDFPRIDASISGFLKMPERPAMLLSLGYKNPDQKHDLTFSYSYDETIINGIGSLDKEGENGKVILSTHNGIKATIFYADGEVVYGTKSSVERNGVVIGHLEERKNIPVIKYTDGSFESLP